MFFPKFAHVCTYVVKNSYFKYNVPIELYVLPHNRTFLDTAKSTFIGSTDIFRMCCTVGF